MRFYSGFFIAVILLGSFRTTILGAGDSHWGISERIKVGGAVGWDYLTVDSLAHRLYVAHSTSVVVIDLQTKSILASLDAAGAHGVALVPDLQRGFFTNGVTGTVSIFDFKKLKVIGTVKVGRNPDAICYEPVSRRVFVFNGRSDTASVLDPLEGTVLGEIPLGGRPEFAQADGRGAVFVNLEDKDAVLKIDGQKMMIQAPWPLPPGSEPSALAYDRARDRLFIGCGNQQLIVLDALTGKIVGSLPIGKGVDAASYDPVGNRVFASCGDGTMAVIHQDSADHYTVEPSVKTEPRARTMAFDSATGLAYLPTAKFGPPPAPTADRPDPRPPILPDSFEIMVLKQL